MNCWQLYEQFGIFYEKELNFSKTKRPNANYSIKKCLQQLCQYLHWHLWRRYLLPFPRNHDKSTRPTLYTLLRKRLLQVTLDVDALNFQRLSAQSFQAFANSSISFPVLHFNPSVWSLLQVWSSSILVIVNLPPELLMQFSDPLAKCSVPCLTTYKATTQ